jgi:hypothetical protein
LGENPSPQRLMVLNYVGTVYPKKKWDPFYKGFWRLQPPQRPQQPCVGTRGDREGR